MNRFFVCLLCFFCCCSCSFSFALPSHNSEPKPYFSKIDEFGTWWLELNANQKLLYTTFLAATAISIWGACEWDYGSADWHNANERWFQKNTKYGGADKLGHFWATYALSDGLTALYTNWGHEAERAGWYGAASAWAVQMGMEIMDATSASQGFSWEDSVVNSLGAFISVLLHYTPSLDRKIDFRIEYVFNEIPDAVFDDYSNQFYSFVVKLNGFKRLRSNVFKYFELHGGYYTRGYGNECKPSKRAFFAGIGVNLSRLFAEEKMEKTSKFLEYIQFPYTVPKVSTFLD